MLNRLSIRTKLALVAVVPLFAMAALAVLAFTTLQAVKVGGPSEQRVVDSHSVVEDVLPPPLFVVEPFLVISLAGEPENAARRDDLLAQYASLKREYTTNHEKWVPRYLPEPLRTTLLSSSYDSAMRFFTLIDSEIVPAIERNDDTASKIIADKVVPVFNEHRAQILDVIAQARAYETAERADVASAISARTIVFVAGLLAAAIVSLVLGFVVSRTIRRSIARLRQAATEDLPRVMEELRDADDDALASHRLEPVDLGTKDELAEAADAFNAVIGTAIGLAGEQTNMRKQTSEMFVNLGRRNQNLVSRQLRFIDSLERSETDADRLAELFRLDNLATRMRRNAESLLVLAGVEPPRRWRKPVRLYDVVRAAMAEIEDFRRIQIGSFDEVQVQGASVANITHLLAELVENAARFSPPDSEVSISGVDTGNGYLLGVHDRGLGMAPEALRAANERLHVARRLDEVPTAYLGLFVVARLADREGITVDLESPEGDGLTAWVRIPSTVLAGADQDRDDEGGDVSALRRLEVAARADQLAPAAPAPAAPTVPTPAFRVPPSAPVAEVAAVLPPESELTAPPADAPPADAAPAEASAPAPAEGDWAPPASLAPVSPAAAPAPLRPPPAFAAPAGAPSSMAAPPPPPPTTALPTRRVPGAHLEQPAASLDLSGQRPSAPAPAPAEATDATKSGFKKRVRTTAPVDFDRFDARTPPTGDRSAEDMKDRLDRFSAGKRFAAAATAIATDDNPSAEDDE